MLGGMFRSGAGTRHFASRIMRLQFLVVGVLIVLVTAGTLFASYDRVYSKAEDTSLTIARTVAVLPEVVEQVSRYAQQDKLIRRRSPKESCNVLLTPSSSRSKPISS